MTLKVYLNNQLIESVPLDPARIKEEQYIPALKRLLRAGHSILGEDKKATFLLEVPRLLDTTLH